MAINKVQPFPPIEIYNWDTDIKPEDYYSVLDKSEVTLEEDELGILSDYDLTPNPFFDDWLNLLRKYMSSNFSGFIADRGMTDMTFQSIWTQITKDNVWHPPHNHGVWDNGHRWSFVWYVDVDEKVHHGTRYYSAPNCDTEWVAQPKQGKFVMWPSDVIHCQLPSYSGIDRAIISGNIELIQ
jgi:hypothetical protein